MVTRELKLPTEIVENMPFPGPELAIRVIGEVTEEKIEILRKATKIVEEETKDVECFQSFAVLLNDKAVGAKKGKRMYGNMIVIRVVSSTDALTALPAQLSFNVLKRISERVMSEIPSVVRCLYDITSKPPATIEFE